MNTIKIVIGFLFTFGWMVFLAESGTTSTDLTGIERGTAGSGLTSLGIVFIPMLIGLIILVSAAFDENK